MAQANIIVPKKDELARLRALVEQVEGEIAAEEKATADEAERGGDPAVMQRLAALEAEHASLKERNERIKALDVIGAPGDRLFLAGGSADTDGGARILGAMITAARRAHRNEKMVRNGDSPTYQRFYQGFVRVQNEGTDTAGGVTTPTETHPEIIRFLKERSYIRQTARTIPMSSDVMIVPIEDTGQTVYWPGEGAAPTDSSVALVAEANSKLNAKTAAVINKVSRELREDALIAWESYLGEEAGQALGIEENRVGLVGNTGASDPFNGIVNTAGVASVVFEDTKTSFSDLTYDKLADAELAVDQSVLGNLTVFMHKSGFLQAYKLKDLNGYPIYATSWSSLPAINQVPVPQEGRGTLLMGNPCLLTSVMPTTAADKTIAIFAAMRDSFILGDRQRVEVAWDDSIFFKERQRAIMVSERLAMLVAKPTGCAILKTAAA